VARRQSIEIRRELTSLIPTPQLNFLAQLSGLVRRRRKVDAMALCWTVVLGFGAGCERSLAGMRRVYEKSIGTTLMPSAFYDPPGLPPRSAPHGRPEVDGIGLTGPMRSRPPPGRLFCGPGFDPIVLGEPLDHLDADAVRQAGAHFAALERLRRGLDLDVGLLPLELQGALLDRDDAVTPVEDDVGVGAVVGADDDVAGIAERGADLELDGAVLLEPLGGDVLEDGVEAGRPVRSLSPAASTTQRRPRAGSPENEYRRPRRRR